MFPKNAIPSTYNLNLSYSFYSPLSSINISPFSLLVPFAAGNADELLDAAGVPQSLGVLHVLGDDLMQRAADSCDGVI